MRRLQSTQTVILMLLFDRAKSKGDGGNATEQRDSRDNTQRAKKDHPEAPDVVIGMQDERGKKGH